MVMDFEALMFKLGGSKPLPQPTPGPEPTPGSPPTPGENLTMEVGRGIIPHPQVKQKSRKSFKTPLATLKPRVKCSKCDFTGKQGKEMQGHVERKHQTEFKCNECNFVTEKKVLRRQHIRRFHGKKKCGSCNYEAENGSTLKMHRQSEHGIVTSSVGFMVTNERQINENVDVEKPEASEDPSKKRKNKSEYLKVVKQVKTSKSKKNMTRSMKDQYLTVKKSVANLQRIHGVDADFMLIVKNNIQSTGAKNSAPTAGKYMVIAEGGLNEQFFGSGVKFDENFVIMKNDYDMQIQEPQNNA